MPICPSCSTYVRKDRLDEHVKERCLYRNSVGKVIVSPTQPSEKIIDIITSITPPKESSKLAAPGLNESATNTEIPSTCPQCGCNISSKNLKGHMLKRCSKRNSINFPSLDRPSATKPKSNNVPVARHKIPQRRSAKVNPPKYIRAAVLEVPVYQGTRVYYDDECFMVEFEGNVVATVTHAQEGWDIIADYRSGKRKL